ncbi:lipopolysaccharide biosynthesis protein [Piscinibacter sp. XHJ-5]|uniref:lipopolysaccharide biosynthesis protein n=1 Tax=Piscinibacter sp. XHJ-5 TaxID=3037797 RepID=UPI002452B619|nr:lipopolysaccharide biosynthesis protein [Piscinibacter sp. XHJ-5]
MARGAAWMVLFRLFDRSVGIVSTTVLARLLVPADFGLVAMAMSVIAIIELATAFSFEVALIQKNDPQREHFDTAWTLNVLVALAGAAVTAALAHPAAAFYGDPRLVPVMFAIGGAWLITGFENVGTVNFRREMNFSAEFRWMASKRVIAFVVTLIAAFTFRSYWALVIGTATGRFAGVVLSYVMHPYRPRLALSRARELFSFSGWLLVNNLAGVLFGRLPHFFVGRVFGAQQLGAYTVGSEIAQLAHTELVAPINRAMFPGYARLVDDPPAFRRVCVDATAAILLVVLPVSAAVAVLAAPMVRVLLGAQWQHAVPIIQILAFAGALTALISNNVSAYLALGRPHLATLIFVARVVVFVVAIALLGSSHGATGVAYAELLATSCSLVVSLPILFGALGLRVKDYVAIMWRPLIASAAGYAAVRQLLLRLGSEGTFGEAALQLLAGTVGGAVVYLVSLWLLWIAAGRPATVEPMIASRAIGALSGWRSRSA